MMHEETNITPEEKVETSTQTEGTTAETTADTTGIDQEEKIEETPAAEDDNNFEQMLEETLVNIKDPQVGDKVEGEIINITDSYIFVSLGGKRDAYAEKTDYVGKNGELTLKIGDSLAGYIVKTDETETLIAKSLVSVNRRVLQDAMQEKIPVSGKVIAMTKGGYLINISGVRAFCPMSQMDNKIVSDIQQYIGESYDFMVIDYKENGRNIVVSRRVLLEAERQKLKEETLAELKVGAVCEGRVTRLTNFGAFIDLGGIEGLLHISEFSWARVESPSDMLSIGQTVEVKVIKIKGEKISLSLRALQEDPFSVAVRDIQEGDIVSCRVLRNLPFGSFVEIKPAVEGLIPISELARNRRVGHPSEMLNEGDLVEAQILRIDADKKKISLSLKALESDPWDEIQSVVTEGEVVNGVIENVVNFGVFVRIADGVTGLLPQAKMRLSNLAITPENVGEEMKVRVSRVDANSRRISLEPTDLPESAREERDDWRKYRKQRQETDEDNPFSVL
jgi:small subunit ribosomal protein S1